AWPKELTQKWKVSVGEGVATPALVGDKLYVFGRQGGNEIIRCLNAADGSEVWQDKHESAGANPPAQDFSGPRCSATVADGKVVTLGVRGVLSCYDAAKGDKLWRKDDFKGAVPRFCTSSSPIVVDGLCIAQLGSDSKGGVIAYDLATGNEKWKWTDDGSAYASPVLLTVGDIKAVVAETAGQVVAINIADAKRLWSTSFVVERMTYNSSTPMVDGQTVIYSGSGRGTRAVKFKKKDDTLAAKELWHTDKTAAIFNTPVIRDGKIFGLSDKDNLFCMNAETGETLWSTPVPKGAAAAGGGGGGGGRMRQRPGYGSIVDAGSVLFALTPSAKLVVFQPSDKEFKEVASYKVADGGTYAYPVIAGNRIFVRDKDSVRLLTIE